MRKIAALWFLLVVPSTSDAADPLRYVVILTRHGVRAPTWANERLNAYSTSPWPDFGVPPGHLTPRGRELMRIMGAYYREEYSSRGLALDEKSVYLWADTDQRTIESARGLAEGLSPARKPEVHRLAGAGADPVFNAVEAGVARQDRAAALAALHGRVGKDLQPLVAAHGAAFETLDSILNGGASRAPRSIFDEQAALRAETDGVVMTGPLRLASTFTENLLLEYAEGMQGDRLGWGRLSEARLLEIMDLHTAYANLMRRTPALAWPRASVLLSRIAASLDQASSGKAVAGAFGSPLTKVLVLSGHDSNVSNVAGLLDVDWAIPSYQPGDVPPGGALIFELWKDAPTDSPSIRVRFAAQTLEQMRQATPLSKERPPAVADLFVPWCSSSAPGYSCSSGVFLSRIRAMAGGKF
jgi:4-phytase/acid phosphatase